MNPLDSSHLSQDLIFRTLDDELTSAERFECELHLAVCEFCRQKLSSLREFSLQIEAAVQATPIPSMGTGRHDLAQAIAIEHAGAPAVLQHPAKVMRRFGWGIGIAATLALGVMLTPKRDLPTPQANTSNSPVQVNVAETADHSTQTPLSTIEVDGETFMPVPYSNADLPITAPHIIQMQVPVTSLTDIGIMLEPVSNRSGAGQDGERAVLADVLVGADGQPRGVHILGSEKQTEPVLYEQ